MNRCYYKVRGGKGQLDFFIFMFYGGFHPPNPLTAERGGANFWRVPQCTAPLSSATDERLGSILLWGQAPIPPRALFVNGGF